MLISVGASNEDEITRTLSLVRSVNDQSIALLHCVLEYPTPYEHANLNKITSLKKATQKIQFTLIKMVLQSSLAIRIIRSRIPAPM